MIRVCFAGIPLHMDETAQQALQKAIDDIVNSHDHIRIPTYIPYERYQE